MTAGLFVLGEVLKAFRGVSIMRNVRQEVFLCTIY